MPSQTVITVFIVIIAVVVLAVVILIIVHLLTGEKIANTICKSVVGVFDPAIYTLIGQYIITPIFGGYLRPSYLLCDLIANF